MNISIYFQADNDTSWMLFKHVFFSWKSNLEKMILFIRIIVIMAERKTNRKTENSNLQPTIL